MFQINRLLIVIQTLIISPPFGLGRLLFFLGRLFVLSINLSVCVLKILNKNRILTSIKGCNFVAKLSKITFYNLKVDLVKDNVHTKFGLSRFVLKTLKKN